MKPLLVFSGDSFDTHPAYKIVKSLFLDFFRGETIPAVNLGGLDHVISVVAGPLAEDGRPGRVYFRVYAVQLKKSGTRIPRVELEEVGPSIDFSVRRVREPDADVWKHATRRPKQGTAAKRKKEKNVDVDGLGDVYGRVHVGDQKLDVIQTRKMKGLKRARTAAKGRTESEEEE
ncbi:MAG: Brix domain-containing protein [Olpidium bornovanus]|uniref:Ribosome production factor 2 homolog n=1 Tax=Olpidium bornovanus TaxID=278681 RepID=A0A8H7ZZQ7_9FUNG|nr:MAG: Brix domain-containing protein [Olpidium bornovanus]